ncbi:MAG: hypothetical protein ACT4QA_10485 [Panacagrimonas sp.]
MNVTLKTIWLAIHQIFSSRLIAVGCSLTPGEITEGFKASGLRQSDLAKGLTSLTRAGFIRLENAPDGPVVRLLNEEFGLLRASDARDQEAANTLVGIRQMRRRSKEHLTGLVGGSKNGRRRDDPVSDTE